MRGKVTTMLANIDTVRITPAYAGKSYNGITVQGDTKDHPRLCGEKFVHSQKHSTVIGSPPPMRGKGSFTSIFFIINRITPAYAGKRSSRCSAMHRTRDHPRLCGEKLYPVSPFGCRSGSPPPMRGKEFKFLSGSFGMGITPAYAGKSL